MGKNGRPTYDWPRRDDVSSVDTSYILQKVEFAGPPPFVLDGDQYKAVQVLVEKFIPTTQ